MHDYNISWYLKVWIPTDQTILACFPVGAAIKGLQGLLHKCRKWERIPYAQEEHLLAEVMGGARHLDSQS